MARRWRAAGPSADGGPEPMLFCDSSPERAAALADRDRRRDAASARRARAATPTWSLLAVKPGALDDGRRAARRRGAGDRLGARRDAGRQARELFPASRRPGDAEPAGRGRRGRASAIAPTPRRRQLASALVDAARPARPPGRGRRGADRRGDGGDGLLAGVPGGGRQDPRRGGRRARASTTSWPASWSSRRSRARSSCCGSMTRSGPSAVAPPGGGTEAGLEALAEPARRAAALRGAPSRPRGARSGWSGSDGPAARGDRRATTSPTTSRRCSPSTSSSS